MTTVEELWAGVVGQPAAVAALIAAAVAPVHSYLFVGPSGSGKRAAARAFAGVLLSDGLDDDGADRARRLAGAGQHPDLVIIERDGPQFRGTRDKTKGVSPAQRLLEEAMSSPREGDRKVVVAEDFHLANDTAIGRLLKVIEEPPARTTIVLLEDEIPPEQVTIASRCAVIEFGPVPPAVITAALVAEGVGSDLAPVVADASAGNLSRARLLASDAGLAARFEGWRGVPSRLDGHGATVAKLAAEIDGYLAAAQAHVDTRHEAELSELEEREEQFGTRGSGRTEMVERQKREVRQVRTDELLFGLATISRPYRERLATADRPAPLVQSLNALQHTAEALERNPIESLLFESLLLDLAPL